ncbi:MAG: sugar ABC transporter substrate-binding protein, partial [Bacillota bacterium]
MKKIIALLLGMLLLTTLFAGCEGQEPISEEVVENTTETAPVTSNALSEAPSEASSEDVTPVHSNFSEFKYVQEPGNVVNISKDYYQEFGIDCDLTVTSTGGWVQTSGLPKTLPTANEEYTIGLAMYFTFDEVAASVVAAIQEAADTCGVKLLVNDANNDQTAQNEALENWLLEGVDGVIVYPCDFYTVAPAIDKLREAGIKVIAGNPPMTGTVDAINFLDNYSIGKMSGEMIAEELVEKNGSVSGTILYGTLPTFHPNAVTRVAGFKDALAAYEGDIEYVEVTGTTQEEFYNAFQDALMTYPDATVCW